MKPGATTSIVRVRDATPITRDAADDRRTDATDTPIEQGATLRILNWAVYTYKYAPIIVKHTPITASFSGIATFNNTDEGVQKLQSGYPGGRLSRRSMLGLVAADLLQPLNHDPIPRSYWTTAAFQNPYYDQVWRYRCCTSTFTTGIATGATDP